MESLAGKTLKNRYRVEESLGRGGMAEVYKVWDEQRGVYLAMKMLRDDLAEDRVFLRRFQREAHNLARLQHPNIIRFYGLEQEGHLAFILMDYIAGFTLRRVIFDAQGPLPLQRAIEILKPVCSALQFAHNQGIVHCDIKSSNIMVDQHGQVFVSDFGIARMADAATSTMVGVGTPAYMAPELVKGQDPTPQTDIYALGVVLYEMLTGGERPFTGEHASITGTTAEKVRWEQLNQAPTPLRSFNPNVSSEIVAVVNRCLEKDPAKRYARATDVYQTIEHSLDAAVRDLPATREAQSKAQAPAAARKMPKDVHDIAAASVQKPGAMPAKALQNSTGSRIGSAAAGMEKPVGISKSPDSPARDTVSQNRTQKRSGGSANTGILVSIAALVSLIAFALIQNKRMMADAITIAMTATHSTLENSDSTTQSGSSAARTDPAAAGPVCPLAFTSSISDNDEIVVWDSINGRTRLTNNILLDGGPAWSPDGTRIAFESNRAGGPTQIYVMNADGSEVQQLTFSDFDNFAADWSPDGSRITFSSYRNDNFDIFSMDADGKNERKLTNTKSMDLGAAWSPDGEQIAFFSDRNGNPDIYLMDADGSNVKQLTNDGSKNGEPAWSPDGSQIAFMSNRVNEGFDIYVMDKDGNNLQRLTYSMNQEYSPAWSPDGSRIAYASDDGYGQRMIFSMNPDGSQKVQISSEWHKDIFDSDPAWSPVCK